MNMNPQAMKKMMEQVALQNVLGGDPTMEMVSGKSLGKCVACGNRCMVDSMGLGCGDPNECENYKPENKQTKEQRREARRARQEGRKEERDAVAEERGDEEEPEVIHGEVTPGPEANIEDYAKMTHIKPKDMVLIFQDVVYDVSPRTQRCDHQKQQAYNQFTGSKENFCMECGKRFTDGARKKSRKQNKKVPGQEEIDLLVQSPRGTVPGSGDTGPDTVLQREIPGNRTEEAGSEADKGSTTST